MASPIVPSFRYERGADIRLRLEQPSDLASDGAGGFWTVGDESPNVVHILPDGTSEEFGLPGLPEDADLEGVAYDARAKLLYVAGERSSTVTVYTFKNGYAELKRSEKIDGPGSGNGGVEGLAFVPEKGSRSAQLIAVNEKEPRAVLFLDPTNLKVERTIKIGDIKSRSDVSAAAKDELKDFSGCTDDPKTGMLYIISQESGAIGAFDITEKNGKPDVVFAGLVEVENPPVKLKKAKLEGIAFRDGDMYVESENQTIYRLKRR